MWHLAFIGVKYGMCGADVTKSGDNVGTADIANANCPECLEFIRNETQINESLHASGMKPDSEV